MARRSFFNFEFKIIAIISVIFLIVFVTGFVAYFRFSNLLENISQSVKTDNRLVLAHSLKNDLNELTNIAKTQSLTEDKSYSENYSELKNGVSVSLEKLQIYFLDNETLDLKKLDSLIADKLIVLDGIIYSEDPFRVQTALGKVVVSLEQSDEENTGVINGKATINSTTKINDNVDFNLLKKSKEQLEEIGKEEEKLLKKLKKAEKKNDAKKVKELDSLIQLRKMEATSIHNKLTKSEEFERDKILTINQIHKGIESVSSEELRIEKKIKTTQLKLISIDNYLSVQIAKIFDEFEIIENATISKATRYAEQENNKTRIYFSIFSVFVALLLMLVGYIIIQYVKKNNLYKLALKKSNAETERLVKTRERLLATISHEIRTPMHAIAGFSEQLSKENLTVKQKDYLTMIQKSTDHLTYLINDILDFSKLQNRKMKLDKKSFNINGLSSEIVQFSQQLVKDNRLKIDYSIDKELSNFYIGDASRIRQILLNLMSNAVKFTDEGVVSMEVKKISSESQIDVLQFVISDTGIGMSNEDLEKVFTEFEQVGKGTKNTISGTGLGLSITKKLIELHGGSISIESIKDKGTKVTVQFKLERGSEIVEVVKKQSNMELLCRSILVVDDEEYNRKLLKSILSDFNITPVEAIHGKEALELLEKQSFDLILIDSRMPVMDGEETVQTIRKLTDKSKSEIKIILLTAAGSEIDSFSKIIDGYVPKPFTQEALVNEINRVCSSMEKEFNSSADLKSIDQSVVDFESLKSISGNDLNFYKDMLQTFITSTSGSFSNMKTAADNNDYDLIANEAHKIASPCKHLGANNVYVLLKEIEKKSRSREHFKQIKELIKELDKEVSLVLEAVNKELASIY